MSKKYYVDTCIWVDLYEDRKGFNNEPLGEYAWRLFLKIKRENNRIVISDLLIRELESNYSMEIIKGIMRPFGFLFERTYLTKKQNDEASNLVKERNVPKGDIKHAIIARDNNCKLITRDKHFKELRDISEPYKPEELI